MESEGCHASDVEGWDSELEALSGQLAILQYWARVHHWRGVVANGVAL